MGRAARRRLGCGTRSRSDRRAATRIQCIAHRRGTVELHRRRTGRRHLGDAAVRALRTPCPKARPRVRLFSHTSVAVSARAPRSRAAMDTPRSCACCGQRAWALRAFRRESPARRLTVSTRAFPRQCEVRCTRSCRGRVAGSSPIWPNRIHRVSRISNPAWRAIDAGPSRSSRTALRRSADCGCATDSTRGRCRRRSSSSSWPPTSARRSESSGCPLRRIHATTRSEGTHTDG